MSFASFLFGSNANTIRAPLLSSSSSDGITMGIFGSSSSRNVNTIGRNNNINSSSSSNNGKSVPSYLLYSYSNLRLEPKDHVKRLNKFSKVFLIISAFFWCWAAHNTKYKMKGSSSNKSFDLGLVSFFISGLTSYYLFRKTRHGVESFKSTGCIGRIVVSASHVVVAINYGLGLYMALTVGKKVYVQFATYCFVFMLLWFYSAYISWELVGNTLDIGVDEDDGVSDGEDGYDDDEYGVDDDSSGGGADFDNNFFDDFDDDHRNDYMFNFHKKSKHLE